jgi:hypothetical protein
MNPDKCIIITIGHTNHFTHQSQLDPMTICHVNCFRCKITLVSRKLRERREQTQTNPPRPHEIERMSGAKTNQSSKNGHFFFLLELVISKE